MQFKLILAIITITLALVFYTIGVFSERKSNILKPVHVLFFFLGLVCDTTGTTIMSLIAKANSSSFGIHDITGLIAILLMLFHAVWAIIVFRKNNEEIQKNFHRSSIVVWFIWLIPYLNRYVYGN